MTFGSHLAGQELKLRFLQFSLKAYQQASMSDKLNTLQFDRDGMTDLDKCFQHFLALMMIHNVFDVQLC